MSDVTQIDRDVAEWLYNNLPIRAPSWNALTPADRAAMVHNAQRIRIAAEKAMLDRLQDLPNEILNHTFDYACLEQPLITCEIIRSVSAGLADALETKR